MKRIGIYIILPLVLFGCNLSDSADQAPMSVADSGSLSSSVQILKDDNGSLAKRQVLETDTIIYDCTTSDVSKEDEMISFKVVLRMRHRDLTKSLQKCLEAKFNSKAEALHHLAFGISNSIGVENDAGQLAYPRLVHMENTQGVSPYLTYVMQFEEREVFFGTNSRLMLKDEVFNINQKFDLYPNNIEL